MRDSSRRRRWRRALAIHPDGRRLFVGDASGRVPVWDLERGERIALLDPCPGWSAGLLAFLPDGRGVAGGHGGLALCDLGAAPDLRGLPVHAGGVCALLARKGGRAVSAGWDGALLEWSLADGRSTRVLRRRETGIEAAAFSENRAITVDEAGLLEAVDLDSGEVVRQLPGLARPGRLGLYPDGRRAFACDRAGGVTIWDLSTGERGPTLRGHRERASQVLVEPAGEYAITTAGRDGLRRFRLADGECVAAFQGHAASLIPDPAGAGFLVACLDGALERWSWDGGARVRLLEAVPGVRGFAWAALAGEHLVAATYDQALLVRDLARGTRVAGHAIAGASLHGAATPAGGIIYGTLAGDVVVLALHRA